jgi:hypothetical protein
LVNLNIKEVKSLGTEKVLVYSDIYSSGDYDHYKMTGYKILSDAVDSDLESVAILVADVDFVSVYKKDGLSGHKRVDVPITTDTNLKAVLTSVGVDVSDLKQKYREWVYQKKSDGTFSRTLISINAKAMKYIGKDVMVEKTVGLYTEGTLEDYAITAYFANSNATEEELKNYTLTGDAGFNIYYTDADGKDVERNVSGTAGKTIYEVLTGENITVAQLRKDYVEWFLDLNHKFVLINLNLKEKDLLEYSQKVNVRENLTAESEGKILDITTYYVRENADWEDLEHYTFATDIDYIEVFTLDQATPDYLMRTITGVAGKTLKAVLEDGDNTEKIVVDFKDLQHKYRETFINSGGDEELVKLNIKAVKSNPLSNKEKLIDASYVSIYPNPVANVLKINVNKGSSFDYQIYRVDGGLVLKGSVKGNRANVNVSSFSRGVYVVRITQGDGVYTSRFVK